MQHPDQACRVCSRMYFDRCLTQQIMLSPTHSRPSAARPAALPCSGSESVLQVSRPGIPLACLLVPFRAFLSKTKISSWTQSLDYQDSASHLRDDCWEGGQCILHGYLEPRENSFPGQQFTMTLETTLKMGNLKLTYLLTKLTNI